MFSEVLRLYFPHASSLGCAVCLIPPVFLLLYCTQMWDHLLHQLCLPSSISCCFTWSAICCLCLPQSSSHNPFASPLHPGCPSPSLLWVSMNVCSLSAWLSDFHIVQFSGSSSYFLSLNLLLSFWLCKVAKCIYLHPHLDRSCS